MANTIRRQIVEALALALDEITIAAGYRNNLKEASGGAGARIFQTVSEDQLVPTPIVQVSALNERVTQEGAFGHVLKELDVTIEALHDLREDKDGWQRVEGLLADIEEVLLAQRGADPILGVAGVRNMAIGGTAIRPVTEVDSMLSGQINVTVQYRHDSTNLEAAL